MKATRHTEERIIEALRESEIGAKPRICVGGTGSRRRRSRSSIDGGS